MFEGFWGRFQGSARLRQVFVRFVLTCRRCRLFGLPRSAAGRMGGFSFQMFVRRMRPVWVRRSSDASEAVPLRATHVRAPDSCLSTLRLPVREQKTSTKCVSRIPRRPGDSARKRPFLRGRRTAGALPAFGPVKKRDEVLTSMNVGVPETPRVWHTRKRPPGADRFSRPPFLPKPTHKTASRSHDRQCR